MEPMPGKKEPYKFKVGGQIADKYATKFYNEAVAQALKREGEVKERLRRIISAFGNVNLQKNEIRQLIADMERK